MRAQVRGFKFPYAFAYIFRFRGAQNHTVTSAKLRTGIITARYVTINTNSPRSDLQLYDYDTFTRPPKYMYLCQRGTFSLTTVRSVILDNFIGVGYFGGHTFMREKTFVTIEKETSVTYTKPTCNLMLLLYSYT